MRTGAAFIRLVATVSGLILGLQYAFLELLDQLPGAVREHQRWIAAFPVETLIDLSHPPVHLVGGCHAGQGKVQALRATGLHQPLGQNQRCFGLARTGHVFKQEELWPVLQFDGCSVVLQGRG